MTDIDAKSLVFGMLIAIVITIIIIVIRKYTVTSDKYGKLERTFEMQKRFNTTGDSQESFLDRGARMLGNGFGYLSKEEEKPVSPQVQKLVDKTVDAISTAVSGVQENVADVKVPSYEATENEINTAGDVAPTSGLPIENSPVEGFGTLRYTSNFDGITGQGVIQSKIAQSEENAGKSVSVSQQEIAEKYGFKKY
jgi:hypothetical protein